jgi:hypothetical protein
VEIGETKMNAYELADDVKNISNTIEALEWVQKATPLLRQQADRIAELEDRLSMYEIKDLNKPQIHCEPLCKPTVCDCFKKERNK